MRKSKSNRRKNFSIKQIIFAFIIMVIATGIAYLGNGLAKAQEDLSENELVANYSSTLDLPEYSGKMYVIINNNIPYFKEEEYITEPFERYAQLDELGRCKVAYANICKEIMPAEGEKRGDISRVKPTGWNQKKYNGEYLYNRCHLIGYQLSNENDNECNLITGTRSFNVNGMLPFENQVANYVRTNKKNVHVLYRVTPIFKEDNLLATGVEIEAYSVEDQGAGICFHVFIYNVEPGISIDYKNGESKMN